MNSNDIRLKPIGIIHTPFQQAQGTPIQPVYAGENKGAVEVFSDYQQALTDLEGFERIWLIFWCDRAAPFKPMVIPYKDTQPHGLFATRAPARPNPIGISCVRLLSIDGNRLHVGEVDILDQTPLLDIKPYVAAFDRFDTQNNGWLDHTGSQQIKADQRFEK